MRAKFINEFERGKEDYAKKIGIDVPAFQLRLLEKIKKAFDDHDDELADELIKEYGENYGTGKTLLDTYEGAQIFPKHQYSKIKIGIAQANKTEEQELRDEFYNLYAFVGYTDFIETRSGNYKKKFTFENAVKIDRYDQDSLIQISGMKMRHIAQYGGGSLTHGEHGVYAVNVTKYLMDEDHYYADDVNKEQMDFIVKNKFKI